PAEWSARLDLLGGVSADGAAMAGAGLDVGRGSWRSGLRLAATPATHRDDVGTGVVSSRRLEVRIPFAWTARRPAWQLAVGPELLLAFERATTSNLIDGATLTRLAPGAGLQAALDLWLSSRTGVGLRDSLDGTPTG